MHGPASPRINRLSAVAALGCAAALLVAAPAQARGLTPADRKAINATLDVFVNHAVKRHDIGASYDVVTPALRGGMSRKQWSRGSIPVYPYAARGLHHGWTVDYVTRDEVGLELLLQPRRGSRLGAIMFKVYVQPVHGRWLVDSFMPAATFAPEGGPAKVRALPDFSPQPQGGGGSSDTARLGAAYIVIPFGILGALLAGLMGWGLVSWYRGRRAVMAARPLTIAADDARARPGHRP
jgi:hypothetical protein